MKFLWLSVFAIFMCALSSPVLAQTNIAVVNVDRIMSVTKAAKSVEKQISDKREEYQKEFSKFERDLRESQEKLSQERTTMQEEAFATKRKEFEKKLLETQQLFQKRRNSLTKAAGTASARLQKEMFQVAAAIAEKDGYSMVFDRKSVVIVEEKLDITEQVIKEIDKNLPDIKLDIEK